MIVGTHDVYDYDCTEPVRAVRATLRGKEEAQLLQQ
jgi:hypothetical protein